MRQFHLYLALGGVSLLSGCGGLVSTLKNLGGPAQESAPSAEDAASYHTAVEVLKEDLATMPQSYGRPLRPQKAIPSVEETLKRLHARQQRGLVPVTSTNLKKKSKGHGKHGGFKS